MKAQARVRVVLIEAVLESPADDAGLRDPVEELAVQALIPEPGIEALGEAVLPGLAGVDQVGANALIL